VAMPFSNFLVRPEPFERGATPRRCKKLIQVQSKNEKRKKKRKKKTGIAATFLITQPSCRAKNDDAKDVKPTISKYKNTLAENTKSKTRSLKKATL
jgi:hypothetical protein